MAKKQRVKAPQIDIATLQPDELNQLKVVVKEYLTRRDNIETEITGLKDSLKDLNEEFEQKVDIKTLQQVIAVLKIEAKVAYKGNFDSLYEVLKSDYTNGLTDEP